MGRVLVELFADFLQRWHPRDGEVAVLEDDPGALLLSGLYHPESNGALALAEGERAEFGASESLGRRGQERKGGRESRSSNTRLQD